MTREEVYNALDKIETELLRVRDSIDTEGIGDDTDCADIGDAVASALTEVQNAMQATDHERFLNR